MRWQHPTRGLLPPGDFIPLAEYTDLIGPLTLLVLRKAARQSHAWRQNGLDGWSRTTSTGSPRPPRYCPPTAPPALPTGAWINKSDS